jgi:hypothetical protein
VIGRPLGLGLACAATRWGRRRGRVRTWTNPGGGWDVPPGARRSLPSGHFDQPSCPTGAHGQDPQIRAPIHPGRVGQPLELARIWKPWPCSRHQSVYAPRVVSSLFIGPQVRGQPILALTRAP